METKKTSHTENASLLKFDPIVLIRDVCKQWLVIVLASLIVIMNLLSDIMYKVVDPRITLE